MFWYFIWRLKGQGGEGVEKEKRDNPEQEAKPCNVLPWQMLSNHLSLQTSAMGFDASPHPQHCMYGEKEELTRLGSFCLHFP